MMRIEAIVFDLDGTLIDSIDAHVVSWMEAFRTHGFTYVKYRDVENLIGLPGTTITERLLGPRAMKIYDSIRKSKDEVFMNLLNNVKLYPHTKEVLSELKIYGVKIALASSTASHIVNKILRMLKLNNVFDAIITGDMVKEGKPHPEIFIKAFNALAINPRRGIVVGDTEYDIIPAKLIGSIAVLILHGRSKALLSSKPDYIINELPELLELYKKLSRNG